MRSVSTVRIISLFLLQLVWAPQASKAVCETSSDLRAWIDWQEDRAVDLLFNNISPKDGLPGAVIASPSRHDPPYYYHWVRDAGIVMGTVMDLLASERRAQYARTLADFASFSERNQLSNALTGLGEPKFYVDGTSYDGPWGRPQNDGPALRAIALTRFAEYLMDQGQEETVRRYLYRPGLPADTVIKRDLEYVASEWPRTNFDLWEEIRGQHFYTRMVQRRALLDGAELAERLEDFGAANWYRFQADRLNGAIESHWDSKREIIVATLDRDEGIDYKWSGLDAAVILAVLHGNRKDGFFDVTDERLLSTAQRLEESFRRIYPINGAGAGTSIGRYPEDRYYGGNPWVLTTAALGEFYYQLGHELLKKGSFRISPTNQRFVMRLFGRKDQPQLWQVGMVLETRDSRFERLVQSVLRKADTFLARIRTHSHKDGTLSEQMNRYTGYMESARDLTWSYSAFITAARSRNRACESYNYLLKRIDSRM